MKFVFRRDFLIGLLACSIALLATPAGLAAAQALKDCPQCQGRGRVPCPAHCDHGMRPCPGKCLKLSVGKWEHLDVAGHPPTDLWQKFPKTNGGYQAWSQNHLGQVVEYRNGDPVLVGNCPICHGKAQVPCNICHGDGEIECTLCQGTGQVAPDVHAPDEIVLKDGRVYVGKIAAQRGQMLQVRTNDGKMVIIKISDLAQPEKLADWRAHLPQ